MAKKAPVKAKQTTSYKSALLNTLKTSLKVLVGVGAGALAATALKRGYDLAQNDGQLGQYVLSVQNLLSGINFRILTDQQLGNLRQYISQDYPMSLNNIDAALNQLHQIIDRYSNLGQPLPLNHVQPPVTAHFNIHNTTPTPDPVVLGKRGRDSATRIPDSIYRKPKHKKSGS